MISQCKECGGSQICVHGRRKSRCKECCNKKLATSAGVNEGASVTKQTEPADLDVEVDMRKDDFDGYVEGFGKIRGVKPLAII